MAGLVAPESEHFYYGVIYPRLHLKSSVFEQELQLFMLASDAGLTPKFRSYHAHSPHHGKWYYDLYTDAWDMDLSGPLDLKLVEWTPEEIRALTAAIFRLPGMLKSLHSHGIIHRDLAGRNIVIRRQQPHGKPKFEIAFIDFDRSTSVEKLKLDYDDPECVELRDQDILDLRRFMCDTGHALQFDTLKCQDPGPFCYRCKGRKLLFDASLIVKK